MKMVLWKSLTEIKKSALIGEDWKNVPQKCKALVTMLLLLPLGEQCRILRGNEKNFKPNNPFSPVLSLVSQLLLKTKSCA